MQIKSCQIVPQTKAVVVVEVICVSQCGIIIHVWRSDNRVVPPFRGLGVYVEYRRDHDGVPIFVIARKAPIKTDLAIVPIDLEFSFPAVDFGRIA